VMADEESALDTVSKHLPGAEMPQHIGMASIALTLAMKYHEINHVQDGTLYQQYKLEGRNFRELDLDWVFETAIRIEAHLMTSSNRISDLMYGTLIEALADEVQADDSAEVAP